jgi:hypothetical protein
MSLENTSYEQQAELALLVKDLADNVETRDDMLRLAKKVRPGVHFPELEIKDRTNSAIEQMRAENEQLKAKFAQKESQEKLEKIRSTIVKKGLVSEDELPKVEELMLQKRIADHETAAEHYNWMKQAAKPTPSGYNPSAIRGFNLNAYWKNPVGAARSEAANALSDLRKPQRPIGL